VTKSSISLNNIYYLSNPNSFFFLFKSNVLSGTTPEKERNARTTTQEISNSTKYFQFCIITTDEL